ncbi:6987_t:CDS:2 [Diversispora eburnea]|uniref:6987_t:CDS:1 n=1 Tax=Diversispora eburnea TaxID=1213867 RepID=A0A9N9BN44_9GLOM|nr:6987_t:CDS:2 [Diversispora eburnea]
MPKQQLRKNVINACTNCKKTKTKCDGEEQCARCADKKLECTYILPVKSRGPTPKSVKNARQISNLRRNGQFRPIKPKPITTNNVTIASQNVTINNSGNNLLQIPQQFQQIIPSTLIYTPNNINNNINDDNNNINNINNIGSSPLMFESNNFLQSENNNFNKNLNETNTTTLNDDVSNFDINLMPECIYSEQFTNSITNNLTTNDSTNITDIYAMIVNAQMNTVTIPNMNNISNMNNITTMNAISTMNNDTPNLNVTPNTNNMNNMNAILNVTPMYETSNTIITPVNNFMNLSIEDTILNSNTVDNISYDMFYSPSEMINFNNTHDEWEFFSQTN